MGLGRVATAEAGGGGGFKNLVAERGDNMRLLFKPSGCFAGSSMCSDYYFLNTQMNFKISLRYMKHLMKLSSHNHIIGVGVGGWNSKAPPNT